MAQTAFVSVEVVDGKITRIEGEYKNKPTIWGELNSAPPLLQSVTNIFNQLAKEGYQHFASETTGTKTIHRFKLPGK